MRTYSISQLRMFFDCPQRWFRTYVLGEKPGEIPLSFVAGKAVEAGANLLLQGGSFEEALSALRNEFWESVSPGEDTDKAAEKAENSEKALEVLAQEFVPSVQDRLQSIQQEVRVDCGDCGIVGYIDYVLEDATLIDLKTAARKWEKEKELKEMQYLLYPFYFFSEDPEIEEVNFEYHVVSLTKRPSYEVRSISVSRMMTFSFLDAFKHQIRNIENLIREYEETKNPRVFWGNRTCWLCSKTSCHVWQDCEETFGWKIRE